MSPAFQQTLLDSPLMLNSEGVPPLAALDRQLARRADPVSVAAEIRYYDTIIIQHKTTKAFLHSHLDRYPLKYDDGRVSSAGTAISLTLSLLLDQLNATLTPLSFFTLDFPRSTSHWVSFQ